MDEPFSRRNYLKGILLGIGASLIAVIAYLLKPKTNALETSTVTPTRTTTSLQTATSTPTVSPKKASLTQKDTSTPNPCFKLLTPENGSMLNASGIVTFLWEELPGAEMYKLEITMPTGIVVTFNSANTRRNQYLETLIVHGTYIWMVTAFTGDGTIICVTEPFRFNKPEYLPPNSTTTPTQEIIQSPRESAEPTDPPPTDPPPPPTPTEGH